MEIKHENRCVKISLPNGNVVDILTPAIEEMSKWIQDTPDKPESGGFIVGYQHKRTGNISLDSVSPPLINDTRERFYFAIEDPGHFVFLNKARRHGSYYMGVWHTHPQKVPEPSSIDWEDWKGTLNTDVTGCAYAFFIIVGIEMWRMWVGDFESKKITEVDECKKDFNGVYFRKAGVNV